MRKIAAVGLLVVAVLTFFPPVRAERIPSRTSRTCLLSIEIYTSEFRVINPPEGAPEAVSRETTSIDLLRLACELLCVGSVTGFLIVWRSGSPTRRDDDAADQAPA